MVHIVCTAEMLFQTLNIYKTQGFDDITCNAQMNIKTCLLKHNKMITAHFIINCYIQIFKLTKEPHGVVPINIATGHSINPSLKHNPRCTSMVTQSNPFH